MTSANFFLKDHPQPLLIAHRGANDKAPENTVSAFRVAAELKADACELDIQLTKDGQLVVFHDAKLDRMTDGIGRLRNYTWSQLKHLKITNGTSWQGFNERIPQLYDVLDKFGRKMAFQIELKSFYGLRDRHQLADVLIKIISDLRLESQVVVKSFDPLAINAVKARAPHLTCGYLLLPHVGWASQLGPGRKAFIDCEIIEPSPIHHRSSIHKLQAQHKRVITWTIDDPNQAKKLRDWKVDGIVTNRISTLQTAIAQR